MPSFGLLKSNRESPLGSGQRLSRAKSCFFSPTIGLQLVTLADNYETHRGYSEEFKRECLLMYVNGSGFRAIARVKKVHPSTVMLWVREVGELLPDVYDPEQTPNVGECDELQTYCGAKKTRFGSGQSLTTSERGFSTGL